MTPDALALSEELAFSFLRANPRPSKPRSRGVTEIRGPYYSAMGRRYLADVLETMGPHVDILKFAGGSFTLMPEPALAERRSGAGAPTLPRRSPASLAWSG